VDLTVVGPEAPLVDGIVDVFNEREMPIVGPSKLAARLEGSKVFCKRLLKSNNIPTAEFAVCLSADEARRSCTKFGLPCVVKADGLAAGKGAIVVRTNEEAESAIQLIMVEKKFGDAGNKVLVEEYLVGEECSVLALTDGDNFTSLEPAQDYKPAYDGDEGPNTGGMGCYSPVPAYTSARSWKVQNMLRETIKAMKEGGCPYQGVLYAGLMLTEEGPKILEYNCRFGDPEIQVILARMKSPLLPLLQATVDGTIRSQHAPRWYITPAVCVVLASPGYPDSPKKGLVIDGIAAAKALGADVIHAGTRRREDGVLVTDGGRAMNVIVRASSFNAARELVNRAADCITFGGKPAQRRRDIALRVCEE